MNHSAIKTYCEDRLKEIREVSKNGTPTGFLCVAAFVDFLAKLAAGCDQKRNGYKSLITAYFPDGYKNFTFSSGDKDLPAQFYSVFRCGILHGFSLFPDRPNRNGTKVRTIVISHDGKDGSNTYAHLSNYTDKGFDAALLLADNLCDDLASAIQSMFTYTSVQANAENWVRQQPPIQGI
jgi:hypothetical protein